MSGARLILTGWWGEEVWVCFRASRGAKIDSSLHLVMCRKPDLSKLLPFRLRLSPLVCAVQVDFCNFLLGTLFTVSISIVSYFEITYQF